MAKNITEFGKSFKEKFNYTGKLTKECLKDELWNEYCRERRAYIKTNSTN